MKKLPLFLFFFFAALLMACEKPSIEDEEIDLSNTLQPYVELSNTTAKTVKQGASTTVTFQMRTALQQKVTVYYDVTGDVNMTNQSVVIEKEKTTGTATINVPAGTIVAPATSATATVTLKKAVKDDGTELTLGAKNVPASQVVTLNIVP